jgi:exodeoxyribonuclease VII large subunit
MMNKKATAQSGPELFPQPEYLKKGARVYTVSEITQDIKLLLENTFGQVWVEGEVSNFRPSQAGHYYFSLKDQSSVLAAVIFSRTHQEIKFKIEDGLKIICHGNIEVYPPRGQYQIIVDKVEPKGIGSRQLALEQLKQRLEKEGLFSPGHKRAIPYLPSRIGVVTSLQGAAIKDILKVFDRRFKDVHIVINPAKVQGEGSREEIAQAIEELNAFNQKAPPERRIEVMIVGRGGGSIEDLWAFNEEIVARAIYNSKIPVISAVGHERDVTVADLVADLRAPTPSVAAELAIPKKEDLEEKLTAALEDLNNSVNGILFDVQQSLGALIHRLFLGMDHILELTCGEFESAIRKLKLLNPLTRIVAHQEKIRDLAGQIYVRLAHLLKLKEAQFTKAAEKLSNLSPMNILARGYSIAFKMPGEEIIKDVGAIKTGDMIKSRVHKGEILSEVREVRRKET